MTKTGSGYKVKYAYDMLLASRWYLFNTCSCFINVFFISLSFRVHPHHHHPSPSLPYHYHRLFSIVHPRLLKSHPALSLSRSPSLCRRSPRSTYLLPTTSRRAVQSGDGPARSTACLLAQVKLLRVCLQKKILIHSFV